jgi:hypothetical protein
MTLEEHARQMSIMLCGVLPGAGSEWLRKIGDEYYVCPVLAGAELQRQRTDARITKRLLIKANRERAENGSYGSPEGVQSYAMQDADEFANVHSGEY